MVAEPRPTTRQLKKETLKTNLHLLENQWRLRQPRCLPRRLRRREISRLAPQIVPSRLLRRRRLGRARARHLQASALGLLLALCPRLGPGTPTSTWWTGIAVSLTSAQAAQSHPFADAQDPPQPPEALRRQSPLQCLRVRRRRRGFALQRQPRQRARDRLSGPSSGPPRPLRQPEADRRLVQVRPSSPRPRPVDRRRLSFWCKGWAAS